MPSLGLRSTWGPLLQNHLERSAPRRVPPKSGDTHPRAQHVEKLQARAQQNSDGATGHTQLTDITQAALRTWIVDLSLKATSVRKIIIPLRGALLLAINDDLIESNPLDQVKLQKTLDRDGYRAEYAVVPFSRRRLRPGTYKSQLKMAFPPKTVRIGTRATQRTRKRLRRTMQRESAH